VQSADQTAFTRLLAQGQGAGRRDGDIPNTLFGNVNYFCTTPTGVGIFSAQHVYNTQKWLEKKFGPTKRQEKVTLNIISWCV
jgi:hypothetical protein